MGRPLAEGMLEDLNALQRDFRYNRTPLSIAIEIGNEDVARVLIETGTIIYGDPDIFSVLVEAGADVNATDDSGRSILGLARLYEKAENRRDPCRCRRPRMTTDEYWSIGMGI